MHVNSSVTIEEGDVLGACVDKDDGLDVVSEIDGYSLAIKHRKECSDMETMNVRVKNTKNSMREQRLHLYAVIGKFIIINIISYNL